EVSPAQLRKFQSGLSGEKKLENFIRPMLAKPEEKPFESEDWVFEIKWDGYRAIADLRNKEPLFYSRNGISFLQKFHRIAEDFAHQKHQMVLDGEIVAFDESGLPNFQLL